MHKDVNVNVSGCQSIIKALQNYNTIIIKPNIVDNRNVLTQEMMSERHTKYIIRWNYSLEGATINVPEDCIVEFAGGTIDNGTIVGNNTILMYSKPIDEVCLAERQGTFIYNTTVADEEDITSASGQLKFKDRPATDGMGKKILRKNIVDGVNTLTQSMMQATNTKYVIRYDYVLGEDITVPANCVLEFEGGSIIGNGDNKNTIISDNLIVTNISRNKIFSGIKFDGQCKFHDIIKLEWFISQYPMSCLDTSVDNTAEFKNCISCGAMYIEIPLDRFIHLTDTIHITKPISLVTNDITTRFGTPQDGDDFREERQSRPCIFSKEVVTLIDYKIAPFEDTIDNNGTNTIGSLCGNISLGKFALYVDVPYSDLSLKETPILNIETNGAWIWGLVIDCSVKSRLHALTVDGETCNCVNYTGIRIESKNQYISFVRIKGYIQGTFYGIYAKGYAHNTANWFTSLIYEGDSMCGIGGYFDSVAPLHIYGTHQTCQVPYGAVSEGYFVGHGINLFGYVWDCGSYSNGHKFCSAKAPILHSEGDNLSATFMNEINMRGFAQSYMYPNKVVEYLNFFGNTPHKVQNVLNQVFNRSSAVIDVCLKSIYYYINETDILSNCPSYVYNIHNIFNEDSFIGVGGNPMICTNDAYALLPSQSNIKFECVLNTSQMGVGNGGMAWPVFLMIRNPQISNTITVKCSKLENGTYTLLNTYTIEGEYEFGDTKKLKLASRGEDILKVEIEFTAPAGWLHFPTIIIPTLAKIEHFNHGTTVMRPNFYGNDGKGFSYYDETLGKPIWWNGSAWVDATGATV